VSSLDLSAEADLDQQPQETQLEAQPQRLAPMRMARLAAPFHRLLTEAPPEVMTTPSMMSDAERWLLYNLAQRYYRGAGQIIDAGIFLGGSTHCFAAGLRRNERTAEATTRWERPIISLERAVVSPTMPGFFARHGFGRHYAPGDSFADLLVETVKPHLDLVELRIGDIVEMGSVDDRIEILFLDVLKNQKIANFAIQEYFPNLIPGRSIVIQQDYFFEGLPFIKTYQEFFGQAFEYIGEVGSSAVFRCVERITQAEVRRLMAGLPAAEQLRLNAVALQRSHDPARRLFMALSRARLVFQLEGSAAASAYLAYVEGDFAGELGPGTPERIRAAIRDTRRFCKLPEA
jgi:hypothetical protein